MHQNHKDRALTAIKSIARSTKRRFPVLEKMVREQELTNEMATELMALSQAIDEQLLAAERAGARKFARKF